MRENRLRHQPATTGHAAASTTAYVTELKLPAVPDYIVVAKRAAASLGLVVDLSVPGLRECLRRRDPAVGEW
jgi:hypothetical protein